VSYLPHMPRHQVAVHTHRAGVQPRP